jgi:Phosphomannose isomerase
MYPLKFKPILKEIIWGGDKITQFKHMEPTRDGIGESWEISDVKDNVSVVANGELAGRSLDELIRTYGERLSGKKVLERFGTTFPLLIKFIDAKQALSIQVHPNDKLAKKRHNSFGKTEMWYVIKADKGAFLYSGFKTEITPEQYVKSLGDDSFPNYLAKHEVKAGDVFFLPAGRVHAIGAGCFIAEIQQTSNITYRIYDYNRRDSNGNPRELHTELAKDAIDYKVYPDYRVDYTPGKNEVEQLVSCPYFTTNLIDAKKDDVLHFTHHDTFGIFICLEGKVKLTAGNGFSLIIEQGETVLIPAEIEHTTIIPQMNSKLLETFIK